jgi:tetrahydromethanopterin S-methyltransferase subunit G
MKEREVKKETDTELLARLMADGFGQVNTRLDGIDSDLVEMNDRLLSVEKGQAETHRRLDSIEKKQAGMLESLDETVHRSEFFKLVQRVEVLEK